MMWLAVDDFVNQLDALSQSIREHGAGPQWISSSWVLSGVLTLAGCAMLAWALVRLVQHDARRYGRALRAMGAALGLGARQRRLVARIAEAGGVEIPAAVLVSRGCFEDAARRYLIQRGEAMAPAVHRLRGAIFD